MRDLTATELASLYTTRACPFCGSKKFFDGPHGGLSINLYCAGCGAGFNLGPIHTFGQLIAEPDPLAFSLAYHESDARKAYSAQRIRGTRRETR